MFKDKTKETLLSIVHFTQVWHTVLMDWTVDLQQTSINAGLNCGIHKLVC